MSLKPIKPPKNFGLYALLVVAGFAAGAVVMHVAGREARYKPLLTDMPGISKKYSVHGAQSEDRASKPASQVQPKAPAQAPAAPVRKAETASALPVAAKPAPAPAPTGPRIVIVLDDWGYNLNAYPALKEVRQPLTLSVLPHLPYSERIARDAAAQGHEIILHMPMEAKRNVPQEKKILLTEMADADIRATLMECLLSIPSAKGVSNHQGSKASEDPRLVRAVLSELKSKGYFYLDSVTSEQTVVGTVAGELSMPYLKRDVFLDNELTEPAIQARLDELKAIAKKNGIAVGVGHDKPITLEMVRRNLPAFEREGIRVVPLSDLLREAASDQGAKA